MSHNNKKGKSMNQVSNNDTSSKGTTTTIKKKNNNYNNNEKIPLDILMMDEKDHDHEEDNDNENIVLDLESKDTSGEDYLQERVSKSPLTSTTSTTTPIKTKSSTTASNKKKGSNNNNNNNNQGVSPIMTSSNPKQVQKQALKQQAVLDGEEIDDYCEDHSSQQQQQNTNRVGWEIEKIDLYENKSLKMISRIVVDKPKIYSRDVFATHVRYRISRYSSQGNYHLQVYRRFSDWVILHQRLRLKYPHSVIPSLPSKKVFPVPNTSLVFLSFRARQLQCWINCTFRHPALKVSKEFHVFMTASTEEWEDCVHTWLQEAQYYNNSNSLTKPHFLSMPSVSSTNNSSNPSAITSTGTSNTAPPLTALSTSSGSNSGESNNTVTSLVISKFGDLGYSLLDKTLSSLNWTDSSINNNSTPPLPTLSTSMNATSIQSPQQQQQQQQQQHLLQHTEVFLLNKPIQDLSKPRLTYSSTHLSSAASVTENIRTILESTSDATGGLITAFHGISQYDKDEGSNVCVKFANFMSLCTNESFDICQRGEAQSALNLFGVSGGRLQDQGPTQLLTSLAFSTEGAEELLSKCSEIFQSNDPNVSQQVLNELKDRDRENSSHLIASGVKFVENQILLAQVRRQALEKLLGLLKQEL